jgi:hypothetical protein
LGFAYFHWAFTDFGGSDKPNSDLAESKPETSWLNR